MRARAGFPAVNRMRKSADEVPVDAGELGPTARRRTAGSPASPVAPLRIARPALAPARGPLSKLGNRRRRLAPTAAEPPRIAPLGEGGARPFWSVAIPTFRPGPHLVETLRSVLAQDPGPEAMQIAVDDDGSGDGVARRTVYEALAGFQPALRFALDWEMWIRLAARYAF